MAQGLDHDLRGHGRTLVRDEERRALAEDHRDTRPPVMRSRVAPPRIGGVLQQLDQEPTVVLAPEKALSSSKRTASPDLLSGVMTRARRDLRLEVRTARRTRLFRHHFGNLRSHGLDGPLTADARACLLCP